MMSLDKSYFNSIRLDTYRHKFYSIEAVDRLLVDIRSQADSLNRELEASGRKLAEAQQTAETLTDENRDLLSKGQALSQEIISLRKDLKAAVEQMLQTDGPFILECAIKEEDNVLPMTPPGMDVDKMMLEV